MTTGPPAYQLTGYITAEAPVAVSYFGMDGRLPRTSHGRVFINGGALFGTSSGLACKSLVMRNLLFFSMLNGEAGLSVSVTLLSLRSVRWQGHCNCVRHLLIPQ